MGSKLDLYVNCKVIQKLMWIKKIPLNILGRPAYNIFWKSAKMCSYELVVFEKFKDTNGEFKKTMMNDVKGMLSLYEASFLSVHGEQILDEAHVFTKANLESLAMQSSQRLGDHIRNALFRPFHKGVPRIEARKYISFYEEDESRNDT